MTNKKLKQNINAVWKECKERPYFYPLAPLSILGFIVSDFATRNPKSVLYKLFNREEKQNGKENN